MSLSNVSLAKALASVAFLFVAVALSVAAALVFRLRCEGFGCTGIGIAWIAWLVGYAPALAIGTALRSALPRATAVRLAVSVALSALVVLGVALACYWLLHNAS
jgi:hypothetical protein